MAKLEVFAIASSSLSSYYLNIHGAEPRDGDIVDTGYGTCGSGTPIPYRYEITGTPGATLHLVVRCPYDGCPDRVVVDKLCKIPPGAESFEEKNLTLNL